MRKFLPFSRRQPSLDRYTVNRGGWSNSDRFNAKSMRRTSATSLNTKSIQVVRGAYNIDLNKVDSSFTKLHRACLLNDDLQVKKHLHKVDNNSHDSSKRFPIHLATVNGNSAIVKLLIENNANPNVQDNEENTPLIKSIECGHEHLVKYLLNNGADPNISDLDNNTALHWAVMTESIIAIEALMSSKKCDLTLRNNKDETCLHLAVRSPLIKSLTFESMVRAGSDISAKDQLGLTALDIAQACNNNVAISAFNRIIQEESKVRLDPIETYKSNDRTDEEDKQTSVKRMCDEYKFKYMTKNRQNLEYEKRLIQLTAQIERLKLDMSDMKERNEKLEIDYEKLSEENSKLKVDNSNLLEQIEQIKRKEIKPPTPAKLERNLFRADSSTSRCSKDDIDLDRIEAAGCRGQEDFLVAKAYLEERINVLKYEISSKPV